MTVIGRINAENFRDYGWIIEYTDKNAQTKKKNLFRVVLKEDHPSGWRIAYLVVRDKKINRLEQHLESYESFEPVKGKALLYLSNAKNSRKIKCFYLDRPVILKKGVWHGVITVDKETEIKITESAKVKSAYWPLGFVL